LFAWSESGSTNEDGYFDFHGRPPGVPFEVRASPQSRRLSRQPRDAPETRHAFDVLEVVDLRSGLQEIRMQIPGGSIRLELDLDREQVQESRISLGVARVPDFLVDPSAPLTRAEWPYEDILRYRWKHSQIHNFFAEHTCWRGKPILLYGAKSGTYRAWASDGKGRLLWASEPFEVEEGMVDLGKIQVRANHPTKIAVRGFPALDPSEFPSLSILAERVPEGNASDLIYVVDGDLEKSLDLIEGKHKLSLWCNNDDSSLPIAESEVFEVPATSEFTWQIPPGVLTGLPAARIRLILEDPD
jgi:hypothetical protein